MCQSGLWTAGDAERQLNPKHQSLQTIWKQNWRTNRITQQSPVQFWLKKTVLLRHEANWEMTIDMTEKLTPDHWTFKEGDCRVRPVKPYKQVRRPPTSPANQSKEHLQVLPTSQSPTGRQSTDTHAEKSAMKSNKKRTRMYTIMRKILLKPHQQQT